MVAAVRSLGRPEMACELIDDADSCALYALSRVAETLILPMQPAGEGGDWLTADGWSSFIARIGGTSPAGEPFHPFLHEIAAVEPADDPDEPPTVVHEWWPGCMIGSMLLLRAGVTVRAGSRYLDPVVTMTSTLHWAYRRRFRPVWDLSHGWGSNSQWSTSFRRDYRLDDRYLYNVDAALDPKPEHPGGMPYNRDLDLLRFRCRTLVDDVEEQWPWENSHVEFYG
ncbi:hypothetical protein [Actinoplanes xinjiangensis]|uniref:hypothetical protein n=1 Tax=Actinoplanes xinjiangensis TaxID=512350 RepID=UPI0034433F0C